MIKESKFEREFCTWLRRKGCFVIKASGAGTPTGTPDRIVLMPGGGWAALEFKASAKSKFQPLQEKQIELLDGMWYARAVYPEIEIQIKAEIEHML